MDGTALALRVLLGLPVEGMDTFRLGRREAHVFDCFAMANCTLCSRVGQDASGEGTATMYRHCEAHLRRTIEILAPTVIIAQGWKRSGISPSSVVAGILGIRKPEQGTCAVVDTLAGHVALVAVRHPSRNWATPNYAGWSEVEAALLQARTATIGC